MAKYIRTSSREFFKNKAKRTSFTLPGLAKGTVGALISPGGCGKSMLAMQICLEIAGGDSIGIGPTAKGKVLYISGEDSKEMIHERFEYITEGLIESKKEEIMDNLSFCTLPPEVGERPNIYQEKWIEETIKEAQGSELIVIDTLRKFHNGDENSSAAMSILIFSLEHIARRSNSSLMFLHHTNKMSTSSGMGDIQQASRGSSVLVDDIRWQGFLSPMNNEEMKKYSVDINDRKKFVRFGVNKVNYSSEIPDVWFKREKNGKLLRTDFVGKEKKQKNQTTFF